MNITTLTHKQVTLRHAMASAQSMFEQAADEADPADDAVYDACNDAEECTRFIEEECPAGSAELLGAIMANGFPRFLATNAEHDDDHAAWCSEVLASLQSSMREWAREQYEAGLLP